MLSHEHYSAKLQHIWGVNSEGNVDETVPSNSTKELKHNIDYILLEYIDNCNNDGPEYTPPSVSLLVTTYNNLKELGSHTMTYYAHEIVKRGISMILLNYKCI